MAGVGAGHCLGCQRTDMMSLVYRGPLRRAASIVWGPRSVNCRPAAKCLCFASVTSRLRRILDTVARMPTRLSPCHAPTLVDTYTV